MNPSDAAKFKKGRDAARIALTKAVNDLCAKYDLNQFEVLHAIVDKSLINTEGHFNQHELSPGLAETYHHHTISLSEQAKAQAAQSEPAQPKPAKSGLKGLFQTKKQFAPSPWVWDDLPAPAPKEMPEYVPLKATKNQEDWADAGYKPKAVVGGTIAKTTVDHYGYELPPGYDYMLTPWGGEYTVVKLTPKGPDLYPVKVADGSVAHIPFGKWITKTEMKDMGVWDFAIPPGVTWAGPGPQGSDGTSTWALVYKGQKAPPITMDLDEHLAEYAKPAPAGPLYFDYCAPKGCIHTHLKYGESKTYTGAYLAGIGAKFQDIVDTLPEGLVAYKNPAKDQVVIVYPEYDGE
jgi:hypothetical protein